MNPPETGHAHQGGASLRLIFGLFLIFLPVCLLAEPPGWWKERGIQNTNPSNDYAAVNQGQLKNIATAAVAELNAKLPGGAGTTLNALTVQLSATTTQTNDYAAVNLGQLKTVAKPFYDRLIEAGYAVSYPWAGNETSANDYAMANIGQVKNLFNFDLTIPPAPGDSDRDGLPDDWEIQYFGSVSVVQGSGIDLANGVTYLQDYLQGRTPNKGAVPDTDGVLAMEVFTPLQ